jgi:hypothetical protein
MTGYVLAKDVWGKGYATDRKRPVSECANSTSDGVSTPEPVSTQWPDRSPGVKRRRMGMDELLRLGRIGEFKPLIYKGLNMLMRNLVFVQFGFAAISGTKRQSS